MSAFAAGRTDTLESPAGLQTFSISFFADGICLTFMDRVIRADTIARPTCSEMRSFLQDGMEVATELDVKADSRVALQTQRLKPDCRGPIGVVKREIRRYKPPFRQWRPLRHVPAFLSARNGISSDGYARNMLAKGLRMIFSPRLR